MPRGDDQAGRIMQILNIFHVLFALGMVILILVQRGAGATAGAAFGSGASGTVFGARGAGNFLTRMTASFAALFFGISMTMAVMTSKNGSGTSNPEESVISSVVVPVTDIASETADDIPTAVRELESDLPTPAIAGEEQEDGPTEEPADGS